MKGPSRSAVIYVKWECDMHGHHTCLSHLTGQRDPAVILMRSYSSDLREGSPNWMACH
jgi:hypothetical protein